MKTMDRRVFIGSVAGAAIAVAVPALVKPTVIRHGPVNIKMVSFFGRSSFKAMLRSNSRANTFVLLPLATEGDVIQIGMPLCQIASIVHRRGQGEVVTTRIEGRQVDHFRLLIQAQRKWSNIVRLMDAEDIAQGNKPAAVFLRLKDIQAVLPKA